MRIETNVHNSGLLTIAADLNQYPQILPEFKLLRDAFEKLTDEEKKFWIQQRVTFGDKHGNPLRLIHELVAVGVLDITKDQYKNLKEIYDRHLDLIKILEDPKATAAEKEDTKKILSDDIHIFHEIVECLSVQHHVLTRQIGDLFADRGKQDLFTFFIFEQLNAEKAAYEIIYSNHDSLMMRWLEDNFSGQLNFPLDPHFNRSLISLRLLLQHSIITDDWMAELIKTVYKPYLKSVSYDLVDDGICFFSHAPVDFLILEKLAQHFKVEYSDKTREEIVKVLADIQSEFAKHITANTLHQIHGLSNVASSTLEKHQEKVILDSAGNAAIRNMIYTRVATVVTTQDELDNNYKKINIPGARTVLFLSEKNYLYHFYFGHVGESICVCDLQSNPDSRYVNLETDFGKRAVRRDRTINENELGTFRIGYSGNFQPILDKIESQRPEEEARTKKIIEIMKARAQAEEDARAKEVNIHGNREPAVVVTNSTDEVKEKQCCCCAFFCPDSRSTDRAHEPFSPQPPTLSVM